MSIKRRYKTLHFLQTGWLNFSRFLQCKKLYNEKNNNNNNNIKLHCKITIFLLCPESKIIIMTMFMFRKKGVWLQHSCNFIDCNTNDYDILCQVLIISQNNLPNI